MDLVWALNPMAGVLRREKWIDTHEEKKKKKPTKMEADYTYAATDREKSGATRSQKRKESPLVPLEGSANTLISKF